MTFDGETPATVRLGAARDADWWLQGRGVPPHAVDLHWDGELLWVAERAGHGRATVDGEPLGPRWRGLGGHCRLEFPGGALLVECSRPGVVVEAAPLNAPSLPPPARSDVREVMRPPATLPEAPTRVAPVASIADEPTRNWQAPSGRTEPGLAPDRPRTMVPPPNPSAVPPPPVPSPPAPGAVANLEDKTIEVPKKAPAGQARGSMDKPTGADNGNGRGRRRASTGG